MIKVGIIGCGALGITHAQRFAAIPGVEVVALAEVNPVNLDRAVAVLAAKPRVVCADYRDILDAGLDAVCIATPDSLHVPQVLDALAANLHVLCEKPLTLEPLELGAVIASCAEVGKVVSMTYPRRFNGGIRAMRREILSGRWGKVKTIVAYDCENWITPNAGTWRHDPELCPGGFFYDANGHQLDTTFWATGLRGEWVEAEMENRGTPSPMVAWGRARLTGGVPMIYGFVGDAQKWREQINIHCERMDFVLESGTAKWVQDGELIPIPPDGPDETADEAFVKHLRGEGPNWARPEELWPVLSFTTAALESASEGIGKSVISHQ